MGFPAGVWPLEGTEQMQQLLSLGGQTSLFPWKLGALQSLALPPPLPGFVS